MQGKAFGVSDILPLSRNGSHEIQPPSPGCETGISRNLPRNAETLAVHGRCGVADFSGGWLERRPDAGTWATSALSKYSPHVNFFYFRKHIFASAICYN